MADFLTSYKVTMGNEGAGEMEDNPADKGGLTYSGISYNNFPAWAGWNTINQLKQSAGYPGTLATDATLSVQVKLFYKLKFWDILKLDQVADQSLATELFDMAVNMGEKTAAVFLQRSLNVLNNNGGKWPDLIPDGIIGGGTLSALAEANTKDVLKCVVALQGAKYIAICENNHTQETFMTGWIRRAFQEIT